MKRIAFLALGLLSAASNSASACQCWCHPDPPLPKRCWIEPWHCKVPDDDGVRPLDHGLDQPGELQGYVQ